MELDLTPIVEAAAQAAAANLGIDLQHGSPAEVAMFKQRLIPLVVATVAATREQIADTIMLVEMDPHRERPLEPGATTSTDYANDFTWAAMIARGDA